MGVTVGEILKDAGAPMCFSVLIDASFLGFCGFSFRSGSALHRLMSENKEMSRNECWCEMCGPRGTELGQEKAIQMVQSSDFTVILPLLRLVLLTNPPFFS